MYAESMPEDIKGIIKKRQDVQHNEALGNNYFPSGWKPRIDFDKSTNSGEVTYVQPSDSNFKFNSLLADWGFDPNEFYIDEDTIKFSTWDTQLKGGTVEQMFAFKAIIKRKHPEKDDYFKALQREIKNKKPIKVKKLKGNTAYMFFLADWQLGKKDWGSINTVKYIRQAINKAKKQIKELAKTGQIVDEIYLIGLGDLIENCYGFYDHQPFNIELSKTEQEHLTRVMVMEIIDGFLGSAPKIVLGGVPGNHGENRTSKGQVSTDRLDNSDTAQLQIVGEIIAGRERYKHVEVVIPDDYHLTLKVKDVTIGFTHGHMTAGGGDPWIKMEKFWKGQMYGWLPIGGATILVSGHYHHLRVVEQKGRTWIQAPSLDCSNEFTARSGYGTKQGILTFTISEGHWDNLRII